MIDITGILHAERVPMMAGTDRHPSIHDEPAALVDAGFTPLEALRAATVQPARFLNTAAISGCEAGLSGGRRVAQRHRCRHRQHRRVAGVVLRGKYHQVSMVALAR